MRPFYAIDNSNDLKNEKENGDEFLVQKPDEKLYAEYDKAVNGMFAKVKKSLKLPILLKIVQYVVLLVAGILFSTVVDYFLSEEKVELKAIDLIIFLIIIICIVIFVALNIVIKKLNEKEEENEEQNLQNRKVQVAYQRLLNDMGVPQNVLKIDILSFNYKLKNGIVKIDKCGTSVPMFYNMEFCIYRDEKKLYLVIDSGKYAFKLSSIKAIHKVEHKNALFVWNKDISYDKGEYKQYKMKEDEMGNIRCKAYYILEIENAGEFYGIYLPEYELETVKTIIGDIC